MAENMFDVASLTIAELRKQASLMKIETQKDWDKTMLVEAINSRRRQRKVCRLVSNHDTDEIPQGFARIRLHLTPQGTDWPVDVVVNSFRTAVPRNVWVDVPKEVRNTLRDSTEVVPRKEQDRDGNTIMKMVPVQCYPFDQQGEAAGESYAIKPSGDVKRQRLREEYRNMYGRWPRRVEFEEFTKQYVEEFQKKKIAEAVTAGSI